MKTQAMYWWPIDKAKPHLENNESYFVEHGNCRLGLWKYLGADDQDFLLCRQVLLPLTLEAERQPEVKRGFEEVMNKRLAFLKSIDKMPGTRLTSFQKNMQKAQIRELEGLISEYKSYFSPPLPEKATEVSGQEMKCDWPNCECAAKADCVVKLPKETAEDLLYQFRVQEPDNFDLDGNADKGTPISHRTGELMLKVINALEKKKSPKFSMYNLSHNEIGDCCGMFDRLDGHGMAYCNECGISMRDAVLALSSPRTEVKDYLELDLREPAGDINNCKVRGENEWEVKEALKTLDRIPELLSSIQMSKISELEGLKLLIRSDSVWTLLRFGYKSPSSSGMDECEDNAYCDLYNISTELRKAEVKEKGGENGI